MPATDREVFEKLTGDADVPDELAFITYALFAHERREWIKHHAEMHGQEPSASDVDAWIRNLTDSQFEQMRTQAAGFFAVAARAYLADEIEERERAILQETIVKEVKAAGAFWRQFAVALMTAILAPVMLGLVIAAALVFSDRFPSIRDLSQRSTPTPSMQSRPP